MPHLLERHPVRKGSLVLTRLAGRRELPVGITRSDLEEAFLALIDRFGLPRPRMNAHLAVRDRFYEIDCLCTWDHIEDTPEEVAADLRRILTPYPSPNGPGALRPLPSR